MAVVGWCEAGGALRISPRFLESASWIRFERSCSILEGRRRRLEAVPVPHEDFERRSQRPAEYSFIEIGILSEYSYHLE